MAMNGMGFQNSSYASETPAMSAGNSETDFVSDPASSGFFSNDYKKHQDLAQMLDSSKDGLKLEAMKRIIGLIAKGKDASDLFPAVVKNVVSKNIEVKKLVYVYLVRYAEEQQDLALLSISTFQRALKDPNQLIRASALRVLSSIRVPMIVPIMMLAITEAVMDMSPYVRKTAAHAIPKLNSLDPEQREQLIELMEKLLGDKTTLVAGSAIQAFEEVCPERIDLIHRNYRKLCSLLVDVEEWGQVVIINMLARYSRTQFLNPNAAEASTEEHTEKAFYESSEDTDKEEEDEEREVPQRKPYVIDVDHRLLLHTCKPLLNSRNAAVVMAVAQLYHHCAPRSEVGLVAKALVRLLRGYKEVQYVVLSNIASMSVHRKGIFEPFLKSFYVRSKDPTHVKLLKLEILTTLATEGNISTILREFQTYVTSSDKQFAAATIQAIGRCASSIAEVTDVCLNGLVSLLSNRNETVVGESVVVIKKLLQMQPSQHKEIIMHLAKLVDTIAVAMARASILWLIGEYSDRVPKIAPDVLRKMAKIFVDEDDIVKLQILNLAAKLCITNSKQTKLLCQYVFNLAKYDLSYDIRDRTRLLRQLILPGDKSGDKSGMLSKHVKKIFFATKPAPLVHSRFSGQDEYQLGSLSHLINSRASEYRDLPEWPLTAPNPSVRNVEVKPSEHRISAKVETKKKTFYSETESSSEESSSGESESGSEESLSASESESETSESDSEALVDVKRIKRVAPPSGDDDATSENDEEEEESTSTEESSSEESSDESDSEEDVKPVKTRKDRGGAGSRKKEAVAVAKPSQVLLDLDFDAPVTGISAGVADLLIPMAAGDSKSATTKVQPSYTSILSPDSSSRRSYDLLNRITGDGLGISYKFTRSVSIFSKKMVSLDLTFTNSTDAPMKKIYVGEKKSQQGIEIHEFPEIPALAAKTSTSALMAIDFNDTTQPAQFQVCFNETKRFAVSIAAPVGELLQPNMLSENDFLALKGKLTGMNENTSSVEMPPNHTDQTVSDAIYMSANVLQIPSSQDGTHCYAGKTAAAGADVLVTVKVTDQKAAITVNCERMVIGSMLVKAIKSSLSES